MRSFITGINGFSGSHLAEYLLTIPDMEVAGVLRPNSTNRNVKHLKSAKLFEGDMVDYGSLLKPIMDYKPDYIFHLAAKTHVNYSFTNPLTCLMDNGVGTMNLLEAVRFLKERFDYDPVIMICSSSEVYGQVDKKELPITENNPLRPSSPYAVSKAYEDMLAYQYWLSWKMKIVRTRAFSHTGPRRGDVFAVSGFAKQIAMIEAGKNEPIIKVGNLDSVRTFADVSDIARAYWLCATKCDYGDVYNICGNTVITIKEILDMLISYSTCKNITVEVDQAKLRPSDVTSQIADCSKFKQKTGWEPLVDFKTETLKNVLNYWRENI